MIKNNNASELNSLFQEEKHVSTLGALLIFLTSLKKNHEKIMWLSSNVQEI